MKKFDKRLLDKYFNNQCTPYEARMVLDWLDTPEGQQYYANILDQRLQNLETSAESEFPPALNDEKILNSIYNTGEKPEQQKKVPGLYSLTKISGNRLRFWPGVAAACAAFLMLAIAYRFYFDQTVVHKTAFGETKTVKLQDGSTVTLNANSQLSYMSAWHADIPREVWLEGEAYFRVTHQVNHQKFLVHTQNLQVEVLGTEFNVHNRRGETQVMLNSGKVKLGLHTGTEFAIPDITMQPSELVVYSEEKKAVEKKIVNPAIYTSWVNHVLVFDDMPMIKIAQMIEDTYGLKVYIKDPAINNMRFNAEVPAKDPEVLLTLLEQSFDLTIEKTEGKVIISTHSAGDQQ